MKQHYHRHHNVHCVVCGQLVWPRATCVTTTKKRRCLILKLARCAVCRADGTFGQAPGAKQR